MEYNHCRNGVYLLNYHLVWCPKRRKPVLTNEVALRLEELFQDVAEEHDFIIISLAVMPNHLHVFVSASPRMPVHRIVKRLKGRTSRVLRAEFPELLKLPALWTNSYFSSTAGNISSETVQKYIDDQKGV